MTSKLNFLRQRTDEIDALIAEALRELERPNYGNGWGIFADPSTVRFRLAAAHKSIGDALALARRTDWPSADEDWGALERAHNTGASS